MSRMYCLIKGFFFFFSSKSINTCTYGGIILFSNNYSSRRSTEIMHARHLRRNEEFATSIRRKNCGVWGATFLTCHGQGVQITCEYKFRLHYFFALIVFVHCDFYVCRVLILFTCESHVLYTLTRYLIPRLLLQQPLISEGNELN